jgi:DNA-binding MarR family transcriptional regulator
MHPIFAEMKGSHLSALRFQRPFTREAGITPCRLAMLRMISATDLGLGVLQSDLHRFLGVVKSAVSIMIRALEKEGFVTRVRCPTDQRTFVVFNTLKANQALRKVHSEVVVDVPWVDMILASAFGKQHAETQRTRKRIDRVLHWLSRFARTQRRRCGNPWIATETDDYFHHDPVKGNPNLLLVGPRVSDDEPCGHEEDVDPPGPIVEEQERTESDVRWALSQREELARLRRRDLRRSRRLRRAQTAAPPPSD